MLTYGLTLGKRITENQFGIKRPGIDRKVKSIKKPTTMPESTLLSRMHFRAVVLSLRTLPSSITSASGATRAGACHVRVQNANRRDFCSRMSCCSRIMQRGFMGLTLDRQKSFFGPTQQIVGRRLDQRLLSRGR